MGASPFTDSNRQVILPSGNDEQVEAERQLVIACRRYLTAAGPRWKNNAFEELRTAVSNKAMADNAAIH